MINIPASIVIALTFSNSVFSASIRRSDKRDNHAVFNSALLIGQNLAYEICIIAQETYLAAAALGLANNFNYCINPLTPTAVTTIAPPSVVTNLIVPSTSASSSTTSTTTTTTVTSTTTLAPTTFSMNVTMNSTSSTATITKNTTTTTMPPVTNTTSTSIPVMNSTSTVTNSTTSTTASPTPTSYVTYGTFVRLNTYSPYTPSFLAVNSSIISDGNLAGRYAISSKNGTCAGLDPNATFSLIEYSTKLAIGFNISALDAKATQYDFLPLVNYNTTSLLTTQIFKLNCTTKMLYAVPSTANYTTSLCLSYGNPEFLALSDGYSCTYNEIMDSNLQYRPEQGLGAPSFF